MAFFRRVIDHLLNQVLVDSLANSRWFQRFAVWSHSKMQNLNETAKDPTAVLDQTLKAAQTRKEAWEKWNRDFQEEMQRLRTGGSTSSTSSKTTGSSSTTTGGSSSSKDKT